MVGSIVYCHVKPPESRNDMIHPWFRIRIRVRVRVKVKARIQVNNRFQL